MKKLLAILLLICPLTGLSQATTGYHRQAQALVRAPQGVNVNIASYATVTVTNTATGLAATIYSDPILTVLISPSVVTADGNGNYGYYIPLNYCVTETITTPTQGTFVYPNVCSVVPVNTCGTTATCSNLTQTSPRIVWGTVTLSGGTATISSMTAWTSTTSFVCVPNDITTTGGAKIVNASTSSITVTGGSSDVVNYICVGN